MDRLAYPQDPSTAPDSTAHDNAPARYIYEQAQHQLASSAPSNPLHSSPPPTASSATMSLQAHSSPYFHDTWGYSSTSSMSHLDPPRRSTATSDAVLTRTKSLHSDIEPPESDINNHVFNHVPQPYGQRMNSQHSQEATYQQHPLPSSYRSQLASVPSYSDLPSTSTPPATGSVRAPSPTNSAESSSVVGRPSTRNTAPSLSLPDLPYTASADMGGYPALVRLPVNNHPHWMNLETHQPGYNGVMIDPALRPAEGDFLHHQSTHTGSMMMREPSASPEPDTSSPSLHHDIARGVDQRPHSAHSSASARQTHTNGGRPHTGNGHSMPRVSSPLSSYQYPTSPSYSHAPHTLQPYQYQSYRNEAPMYSPLNIPSHTQILQPTPVAYTYTAVASSDPTPSRPTGPTSLTEGPGNATPGSSASTAVASNQIANPTRSNSKTKTKLTDMDRKFICVFAASHPKARQEDIATKFAVERSTVSKILKCKDKWMKVDFFSSEARTVKHRPSKFPEIESELIHHIRLKLATREPINDSFIKKTALALADERGIGRDKFKASSGWVENFKHRHDIRRGGVFSSGDRPGAIPIPGAVLSVPGNGGSLPADGSSGVIIGTPVDGIAASSYNGYGSAPSLDDSIHYNGENGGNFDAQHHGSEGVLTASSQERHAGAGFSHNRTGMKTRSMRSDSLASQRRSTVSSSDADIDESISHQDPISGDVDMARGYSHFNRISSPYGHHDRNIQPSEHSRCENQGGSYNDHYSLSSSGDHYSQQYSTTLSRSGSATSASANHPVVTPSPTAQMIASPTSVASHFAGSPIGSPILGDLGKHSPIPDMPTTQRSLSASFGSSPLSQHVGTPNSTMSMAVLSSGPTQNNVHGRIVHAGPTTVHKGGRANNRRSVTFSEFSHGYMSVQERSSSGLDILVEDGRYECESPQTEPTHHQPRSSSGPLQPLNRATQRRSGSFSSEDQGPHSLELSTTSTRNNSAFLADSNTLLSSRFSSETATFAMDHGRYSHTLKTVNGQPNVIGEPLIAEYGYDDSSHEGRITGEAELLMDNFMGGKTL